MGGDTGPMGGGLAHDLRQNSEVSKISKKMEKRKKHVLLPRFSSDGPLKHLWLSYQLYCSQTDLLTDLHMVSKFTFICYGHIKKKSKSLCLPLFYSDSSLKYKLQGIKGL